MTFPSEEQSLVIDHRTTPLIVVAGPGTGKTRTLVERMITLLAEDPSRQVTFITFTRTSRGDTQKKLREALGETVLDQGGLTFPRISTLHAYAKRLVHRYAPLISLDPTFSILIKNKGEQNLVAEEIIGDLGLTIDQTTLQAAITCYRATGEWPTDFCLSASDRLAVLDRLALLLTLYRTLDMEGVVIAACRILESGQAALREVFLQVDEYQDLDPMDQRFVDLAASQPGSQVVVVADDAQSIYGGRHAHPEGVRSLWDDPDWCKIRFPDCFRLPSHILNAALDLLSGCDYLGTEVNRKDDTGKRILTVQCTTANLQIEAIGRHISELVNGGNDNGDSPITWSDMLVLCPTGAQARQVADSLAGRGIPAHVRAGASIPDGYWPVVLLLRILHNRDPLALRQWLPVLGLSSQEIRQLRDESIATSVPFSEHCLSLADARIVTFRGDLERVRNATGDPDQLNLALNSLAGVCTPPDFTEFLGSALLQDHRLPSWGELVQAIYHEFGVLEEDAITPDQDRVLVATMHSAKGLEARFVYCLWMNARYMPLPGRDPDEQRRIMYVALTRAKQDVVLSFHELYEQGRRVGQEGMSPFMAEIRDHLRIVRVRAPDIRSASFSWGEDE